MSLSGIRLLRPSDIPGAMRLKEAAGWNQTTADWERLLELEPEGCFCLEHDGILAATATAVTYGDNLAWIGMVLTLPEFRGRGFARSLMTAVMDFAAGRGVATAALDATDMGIALYRQFGFESAGVVERCQRLEDAAPVDPAGGGPWELAADLDRSAFGTDRGRLLASLASSECASIPGLGYAMARPGSKAVYFGPSVTRSADSAECLLRWFLSRHPQERVYWDILEENRDAMRLASQYGFHPVRRLTRMLRGPALPDDPALVFAIAGFEYG